MTGGARPLVIDGCAVATVDGTADGVLAGVPAGLAGHDAGAVGAEYPRGHLVVDGGRIAAVGPGPAPVLDGAQVVDGAGCLATPGLIAAHQHLFQRLTRGVAPQAALAGWLAAQYPVWSHLDPGLVGAAARAGLATLALSGCTTVADHHYLFPRGGGDLLAAVVAAAQDIGLRLHCARGSLDLGRSAGGLPPDSIVAGRDEILAATERDIGRFHDPGPD